jgi:hypothetical protein
VGQIGARALCSHIRERMSDAVPTLSVAQLEVDCKAGVYELPRDEDEYYLCCFQNCDAPVRDADIDKYFAHLRQHEAANDKMLTNMISYAKPGRVTVLRRRNDLALGIASIAVEAPPSKRRKAQVHIEEHGSDIVAALDGIEVRS